MHFKDFEKKDISVVKDYNYCLGAKSTCIIFYPAPYDNHGDYINYTGYKGSFSAAKTKYKSYSKKIVVSSDIQTIFTNFSAINTTDKKDSTELFTIDHNKNWVTPANVKIYVDWAY